MKSLKRLHVTGWKSIKDQAIDLGPINVLIGANGAGKSNLISFLPLLTAVSLNDIARFVVAAGGASTVLHGGPKLTQEITCCTQFEDERGTWHYGFTLGFSPGDKMLVSGEWFTEPEADIPGNKTEHVAAGGQFPRPWEGGKVPDRQPAIDIHNLVSEIRTFHFQDTSDTAPMRLGCYIERNQQLERDAGNLAAMLYLFQQRYPTAYLRIVATIRAGVPGFKDFDLQPQRGKSQSIVLNWRQPDNDYVLGPHQLSDGSIRFIALATLLNQPSSFLPSTVVIDEPELGLHPAALGLLAGAIQSAAVHCQLVIATQSAALLNHFKPEEVLVVHSRDGASQFERLSAEALAAWLTDYSLGEIWDMNVFGGGPYG